MLQYKKLKKDFIYHIRLLWAVFEKNIEKEIFILNRAVFEIVLFPLKRQGTGVGLLKVLRSSHWSFFRLLNYIYFRLANGTQKL